MLEFRRLSVEVPGETVFRDLDLVIEKGETVALFGPNGSGKTTLVKAILRQGTITALPELGTGWREVEMSHEAAIGRISNAEIEYLRSRGMPRARPRPSSSAVS
ncbi:MAG: ATP-binding cassette domain-containing protein [Endomicrobiales bacterium]